MSTLATQIAQACLSQQGCRDERVEEAAALAKSCDFVLTRFDGMTFSLVCIVDAERDASKCFGLERAEAKAILAACLQRFAGTLGGAKQPVPLIVVEVRGSTTADDVARLRALSNTLFDTNAIHAFIADASTRQVTTATKYSFLAAFGWKQFLKKQLA